MKPVFIDGDAERELVDSAAVLAVILVGLIVFMSWRDRRVAAER